MMRKVVYVPMALLTRSSWLVAALLSLVPLAGLEPLEAHAQSDLRKSFPGRRVGGGTRG